MSRLVGQAYDGRAEEYVGRFGDVGLLAPADRDLVGRWGRQSPGLLLDAGCGPGHWTRLLQDDDGVRRDVLGLDASARLLAAARARHPGVPFVRASLDALPLPDASVGGVLAWYSLIHTPPESLPGTFRELRRVLRPGGSMLLGFFDGPAGDAFPHAVTTAWWWSVDAITEQLADVGLGVVEHHRRHDEGHRPHAALVARLPVAAPRTAVGR